MNMNARQLAFKSKISVGMLSQLENGATQGSVETLRKIAKVLNTTLAQLFTDEDDIKIQKKHDISSYVVRKKNRKKISLPDALYSFELLVPNLQGDIEFVLVKLGANRVADELIPRTQGGEECNFVLKGKIIVTLGKEEITLNKGDCIRFDPSIPHKVENKSSKKASYISAITPVSF